jgi:hypothetical protein
MKCADITIHNLVKKKSSAKFPERAWWYTAGVRCGLSGVLVRSGAGNFSLHHRVQTGSGVHPASHSIGTRGSFPEGKAAEA